MAIARDSTSSAQSNTTSSTTVTFSHTIVSTVNGVIYAGLTIDASTTPTATATFAGNAMTQLASIGSTSEYVTAFRLVNPPVGANNVVISWSSSNAYVAGAVAFTGVHQSTPDNTPVTSQSASSSQRTDTVNSSVGDLVLDFFSANNQTAANLTMGSSQTEDVRLDASGGIALGVSHQAGAASVDMKWRFPTANRTAHIAFNINQAPAGTTPIADALALLGIS